MIQFSLEHTACNESRSVHYADHGLQIWNTEKTKTEHGDATSKSTNYTVKAVVYACEHKTKQHSGTEDNQQYRQNIIICRTLILHKLCDGLSQVNTAEDIC